MKRGSRGTVRNSSWMTRVRLAGIVGVVLMMGAGGAAKQGKKLPPLQANPVGIFEGHGDIGEVEARYAGNVEYDKGKETYTITGGGENIWYGKDAFHFAWKPASGDVSLSAEIEFWARGRIRTGKRC